MQDNLIITCLDETDTGNPGKWISSKANYDIVLLSYSKNIDFNEKLAKLDCDSYQVNSGKWKNIRAYFYEIAFHDHDHEYDYFWFPDSDLEIEIDKINDFFSFVNEYRFDLCQPSLSKDSFGSHEFLYQKKHSIFRQAELIEVMCPCFSRNILEKLFWTFDLSYSGYGLDLLWAKYIKGYVIDMFHVKHLRRQQFGKRARLKNFPNPEGELQKIRENFRL